MDPVNAALRQIRRWFVVWFIAEAAAGTAAAAYALDEVGRHPLLQDAMRGWSATGTILAGIGVSLVLLLLSWAVLEALLQLRPWARIVMLVFGWIKVVSAAINLLTLPVSGVILARVTRLTGGDWTALAAASALTKAADLAFWSWVIYMLQMNPTVRAGFFRPDPLPAADR